MDYLSAHRQSVKGLSWISDILPGLAIFFVPFFSFLSPINLKQIPGQLILKIFVSLLFILLVVFVLYYVISIVISKLWGKEIKNLFLLCCFGFYLLFLYMPIRTFLYPTKWYTGIVILLIIWLATIYAACKFDRVVKRLILVFSILMLTSSIVPMVGHIYNGYFQDRHVFQQAAFQVDKLENPNPSKHNIYYIIMDAMSSIEEATLGEILDERPVIPKIEDLGLRYIEKSLSSYNVTYLTLFSLFHVDHFLTEDSERYLTRSHAFFPWGTWNRDGTDFALLSYLEKAKSYMYWVGNDWAECKNNPAKWTWTCIQNDEFRETLAGVPAFYHTTPIGTLIRVMGKKQRDALKRFLDHVETFGLPKKRPFFALIHHMLPHPPFLNTETCEQLVVNQEDKKGYRDNYRCALIRIDEFMKKINILDPDAIVVIQGDHGWPADGMHGVQIDAPEIVRARGRIFNAIKAPNSCFEKYGEPKTNVNSVRFVLNCAYGFELPFRKDVHYMGYYESNPKMFGKVFERKIY